MQKIYGRKMCIRDSIDTDVKRVVYIIETHNEKDVNALELSLIHILWILQATGCL